MVTSPKKTVPAAKKSASAKPVTVKPETRTEEPKKKQSASSGAAASVPKAAKEQVVAVPSQPKAKVAPKEKPVKEKIKKAKLVRDSFTMPENEYQVLGDLKKECVKAGFEVKKSELLRISVALLKKMPVSQIQQALSGLPPLKAGRPKKEK